VLLLVSRKGAAGHPPAGIRLLAGFGARRTRAERARAEATALSRLAVRVLSGHGDPAALLEEIQEMFGLAAVSLLEQKRNGSGPRWYVMASAGDHPPESPAADVELPITDAVTLAARGRRLSSEDVRVLTSCAVPMVADLIQRQKDEQDAYAAQQTAGFHSRSALLTLTSQQAREQLEKAEAALAALEDPDGTATRDGRATLIAEARHAIEHATRSSTSPGSSPTSATCGGCTPERWRPTCGRSTWTRYWQHPWRTWVLVGRTSRSACQRTCRT
jgi:two-component system, OmpR family, sensor histidine kinase KdpD